MPALATNKKARFDYEILETYEAGLVLTGGEVKSIRAGHVKLSGAFVTFHGDTAYLTNAHISAYPFAAPNHKHEPDRSRKLLLKKKEIDYLRGKMQEQGLTIVPLSVYTKKRLLKIEIGVARGKKKFDKRETIKRRDVEREMARERNVKENRN